MVGDGVNDAPALVSTESEWRLARAPTSPSKRATSCWYGVILTIAWYVRLSRASYRKMVQNPWWAALQCHRHSARGRSARATRYPPISGCGAVLMSFSTVILAVDAQLLRRSAI